MTRRDYELLAAALRRAFLTNSDGDTAYSAGVEQATFEIERSLSADNPQFSRERFRRAVRPELFALATAARRMGVDDVR
jgi:hypothetical protein